MTTKTEGNSDLYYLDNNKDESEVSHLVCDMAINLAKYSPMVCEPLIGTLSLSVLTLKSSEFMCEMISLYHKLRQLPKFMARMLIAINKSSSKSATNQFQFDDESLQCFAEKVIA